MILARLVLRQRTQSLAMTCSLIPVSRQWSLAAIICSLLILGSTAQADCYPFQSAKDHLGEVACIQGKVVKVVVSATGLHFLNFCEDYKKCPFTVVIFPRDLRDVGDVRALEGKDVEIYGKVRSYRGQFEIILRDVSQLRGDAASIPNLPKGYDVAKKGSFSAGTFKGPKSSNTLKTPEKGRNDPTFPDE
jgi:hypothetical protein